MVCACVCVCIIFFFHVKFLISRRQLLFPTFPNQNLIVSSMSFKNLYVGLYTPFERLLTDFYLVWYVCKIRIKPVNSTKKKSHQVIAATTTFVLFLFFRFFPLLLSFSHSLSVSIDVSIDEMISVMH